MIKTTKEIIKEHKNIVKNIDLYLYTKEKYQKQEHESNNKVWVDRNSEVEFLEKLGFDVFCGMSSQDICKVLEDRRKQLLGVDE